jgi:DNA-binding IscR family transcriptional regulator
MGGLLDLIEMLEGPSDDQVCVFKGGPCDDSDTCAMHASWLEVRTSLIHQLSSIPISSTRKE